MISGHSKQRGWLRFAAIASVMGLGAVLLTATPASARTDPVRDGKFEFTAQSVKCGVAQVGEEPFGKTAQGTYCLITLMVKNVGSQSQTFDAGDQKAFSANGTEYSTDVAANTYANPNAEDFLNEINPGNTVKATLVYDVPAGTTLTRMEVHDSLFSGGATLNLS